MVNSGPFRAAHQKIERAHRIGAIELNLSCEPNSDDLEKLSELPDSISELNCLQTLNLSNNHITALPESLSQLTQLQMLNLSGNKLTTLPESLSQLKQLQTLTVSDNQLTELPESLGQLIKLQSLDLYHNELIVLPESLGQLTQLQKLTLSGNQLMELPESLGQLKELRVLDLTSNRLTTLPESLGKLMMLKSLNLNGNQLKVLPVSLGELQQLESLCLGDIGFGGNPLGTLPSCVRRLKNLKELWVTRCNLTELPYWLCELREADRIEARGNHLTTLPSSIGELAKLKWFAVNTNHLNDIPASFAHFSDLMTIQLDENPLNPELDAAYKQGIEALKEYLRAKAEDQIVLNEAKLILIGEGEVGKTSLLGALRGDEWLENRPTTHGVEVDIKSIVLTDNDSGTEITFNGWDFGGQNIYRHTHQLFFTAPAVYLAVWNPRRGPEQCCIDEWVKMVRQRAYDETRPDERPRILVVATHGGPRERSAHIDEQLLRDEFGDLISGFHHVDSKTGHGLDELKDSIAREAAAIPSVGRSVPTTWKNLLDSLQKQSEQVPYISYKRFRSLCRRHKVADELGITYAAILNELGYLIYYQGDEVLQDTVILKPEYISKAISYVLEDDDAKEQNGLVEHDRLCQIWNDPDRDKRERFPAELHRIFLRLMDRFDLSYQVAMPNKNDPETSLVAQLVPGGRPEKWEQDWPPQVEQGDTERRRICRLVDVETGRPAEVEGLLYRLIVRLHRYSLGKHDYFKSRHWKTGMILSDGFNGRAFIEELSGDVHVTVRAAYPDGFLGSLCNEIRSLVDQFWRGLDCRLSVPCHAPCKGLHEVEELVETKREGILKIRCSVCKKFYEIDLLLVAATPKQPIEVVLAELTRVRHELSDLKGGVFSLDADVRSMIAQANEQFDLMMNAMTSLAKDGPRLFSFHPVNPGFFDKPKWIAEKFHLTLWCEHSRLPLKVLNDDEKSGVYTVELTKDWVKKAAPVLKVLSQTLSLALPIASPAAKLAMDTATYKSIEDQLNFGKTCAESFLKGSERATDWLTSGLETELDSGRLNLYEGAELRELHSLLKEVDPKNSFGGLVRVQNKRRQFLWVHENFVSEY